MTAEYPISEQIERGESLFREMIEAAPATANGSYARDTGLLPLESPWGPFPNMNLSAMLSLSSQESEPVTARPIVEAAMCMRYGTTALAVRIDYEEIELTASECETVNTEHQIQPISADRLTPIAFDLGFIQSYWGRKEILDAPHDRRFDSRVGLGKLGTHEENGEHLASVSEMLRVCIDNLKRLGGSSIQGLLDEMPEIFRLQPEL